MSARTPTKSKSQTQSPPPTVTAPVSPIPAPPVVPSLQGAGTPGTVPAPASGPVDADVAEILSLLVRINTVLARIVDASETQGSRPPRMRKGGEYFIAPFASVLRTNPELARLSGVDPDTMEMLLNRALALTELDHRMVLLRKSISAAKSVSRDGAWTQLLRVYATGRTVQGDDNLQAQVEALTRFLRVPGTHKARKSAGTAPSATRSRARKTAPLPTAPATATPTPTPGAPGGAVNQGPATPPVPEQGPAHTPTTTPGVTGR